MPSASVNHAHRTLRRFGLEIFLTYMIRCTSSYGRLPPSMLRYLEFADRSSRERWQFATSARFLGLYIFYFIFVLFLNQSLGLSVDILLLAVQAFGIATLYFLTLCSKLEIPRALAASLKFPTVVFTTLPPQNYQFSNFTLEVLTPPPNF